MLSKKRKKQPIGVFDSGLGGLTVVKEIMRLLPDEDVVYFGDTARVPYGTKSKEAVIKFSKENVALLLTYRVKMIVVACNTSSSVALPLLRKKFSLPIKGVIEPGAKRAVHLTRNKRVGVIATQATVNSAAYTRMIKKMNPSVKVFSNACPLFVPLVEEGWINKKITRDIAKEYLKHFKKKEIGSLILACTHYPVLERVIKKEIGRKVFECVIERISIDIRNWLEK